MQHSNGATVQRFKKKKVRKYKDKVPKNSRGRRATTHQRELELEAINTTNNNI